MTNSELRELNEVIAIALGWTKLNSFWYPPGSTRHGQNLPKFTGDPCLYMPLLEEIIAEGHGVVLGREKETGGHLLNVPNLGISVDGETLGIAIGLATKARKKSILKVLNK